MNTNRADSERRGRAEAGPATAFPAALERLSDLQLVEAAVREVLVSDARLLHDVPAYLHSIGGKRIRPALCLFAARSVGLQEATTPLVQIAAGIELIHMATLLHDDIIDESPLRRHHPSPLAKFGMASTLLAGDFLYVRAFGLCSRLDRFIIEETERACVELTEGEVLETSLVSEEHSLNSSLTISLKKTAALFRLAALSGVHLAGAGEKVTRHMAAFGENLGVAFQILDDILDVTSAKEVLGKEPGIDLRERKPSIVNVLWLETGEPLAKRLREPVAPDDETQFVAPALAALRQGTVIASAKKLAEDFLDKARMELNSAVAAASITSDEAVAALHSLLDFTLLRAS